MTHFLRVIPNYIYEDLEERGLLVDYFPDEKKSSVDKFVENYSVSLRPAIKSFLDKLVQTRRFSWNDENEIIIDGSHVWRESNLFELLQSLILESNSIFKQQYGQEFIDFLLVSNIEIPHGISIQVGKGTINKSELMSSEEEEQQQQKLKTSAPAVLQEEDKGQEKVDGGGGVGEGETKPDCIINTRQCKKWVTFEQRFILKS